MGRTVSTFTVRSLLGAVLILIGLAVAQEAYAQAQVIDSPPRVLQAQGVPSPPAPEFAERAADLLTEPVIAVVLISLGVLLLLADLFTAGFGVAGILGLALLTAFFWGHYQAGLAGWESVALVALGLTLIGLEVFVIPGFGVAGILGLLALVGGLFLSMIGNETVMRDAIVRSGSTVAAAVISIVAGAAALLWLLPRLPWLRSLILQSNLTLAHPDGGWRSILVDADDEGDEHVLAADRGNGHALRGAKGTALSDLRPGGYARIGERRIDVITRGDYIPAGTPIEVIADQGYRRVVRRLEPVTDSADAAGADIR